MATRKEIIEEAGKEAERIVFKRHNVTSLQMGMCHEIWAEQKKILKEKGIRWKSPQEMNPRAMFD